MSRKQKGSKAQSRARKDVARVHKRVANVRNDWQWKQARFLVTVFDLLVFETLNIKAMHQIWGRKVSDLGFADFLLKTQWMATKLSKEMVKIDRWKPTRESATFAITDSKCPSICGHSCAALAGTWKIAT